MLGNAGSVNTSGIYGVEQACQYFFGKSVSDISLAEASIIAGMFQNPELVTLTLIQKMLEIDKKQF